MNFVQTVHNTPDIAHCLQSGLQALGKHSAKIHVAQTRALEGSVDIDTCLKKKYPAAHRWDYVFGYQGKIYYVETHPASSSAEVKIILDKLTWLKEWRKTSAPHLEELCDASSYHWIATGSVKRSKYALWLAQNGITPQGILQL